MRFLVLTIVAAIGCCSCKEEKLSAGKMREILHERKVQRELLQCEVRDFCSNA